MIKKTRFEGIYKIGNFFATKNFVKGKSVYGEKLVFEKGVEYRIWDHFRSKPAAALKKGLKAFPLKKGFKILYLGIGSGTTASHFSDLIEEKGIIYGIEISEKPLIDLIELAKYRKNILPILADARKLEEYENLILEKVDLVYEDLASPDQIEILIWNSERFLKKNGYAMIAIKSQSIDTTKNPKIVYKECIQKISNYFEILDKVELDPFEKYHLFLVLKSRF